MKRGALLVLMLAIVVGLGALAFARPGGRAGAGRGVQSGAGGRISNGPGQNGIRSGFDNAGGNAIDQPNRGVQGREPAANSQTGERRFSNDNLNGRNLQQAAQEHLGLNGDNRAASSQSLEGQYNAASRPFTGEWYGAHPNAWQVARPHADAWAVASLAGTNAWLGWGAAVPVDYDDYYNDTAPETLLQDAGNLAVTGMDEVSSDGDWLNLGTYALAPRNQSQATLMLTLAVNKDGILRGNYIDLLSNSSQTIYGAIDKPSRRAAWVISSQGRVTLQTTLNDLTANNTPVSLQFENGRSELWNMVRQTTQ